MAEESVQSTADETRPPRRKRRRRQFALPGETQQPANEEVLRQRKHDAIHRALLTGLLGNIGQKTDPHEYTGARGMKFNLFPGSALFRKGPPWVMAAELVETTRLYARTVAPIQPQWVERAAAHLVKREHSDPHWRRETATVVAHEKVSLYGLSIVPRRMVNFGPIDPIAAREMFIWNALVEGEYDTDAQYFRHNQNLIRELELMEAKLRTRSVLVDAKTRFAFYDARVPAGIHSGFLFERWRREAEAADKRLLFMTREDLTLRGAKMAEPGLYPDSMTVEGVRVQLDYRLDPGHPADGVTATIPLSMLNALPAQPFEWLAPGMLKEKVALLIKTLPKPLRVKFVPVPESAERATAEMPFGRGSLLESLGRQLAIQGGDGVPVGAFKPEELPSHFLMNFRVVDESGNTVAMGRDLDAIRETLGVQARSAFESLAGGPWHRDGIQNWDFGDLPEKVEFSHRSRTLLGYPALVDRETSVSLRLMDSQEAARRSTAAGVRRLFALQLRSEMTHISRHLPGVDRMALHYAPLGRGDELKRLLLAAIVNKALFDGFAEIRTQAAFIERAEAGWRRLSEASKEICAFAAETLAQFHDLSLQLGKPTPPLLGDSIRDLREQLAALVPSDFLTRTPAAWLPHVPRFLRGMQIRLKKLLNAGLSRDAEMMRLTTPHWIRYGERERAHRKKGLIDPALELYRWMLEEYRVSLFSQELKTSIPISAKRLDGQWALVAP